MDDGRPIAALGSLPLVFLSLYILAPPQDSSFLEQNCTQIAGSGSWILDWGSHNLPAASFSERMSAAHGPYHHWSWWRWQPCCSKQGVLQQVDSGHFDVSMQKHSSHLKGYGKSPFWGQIRVTRTKEQRLRLLHVPCSGLGTVWMKVLLYQIKESCKSRSVSSMLLKTPNSLVKAQHRASA